MLKMEVLDGIDYAEVLRLDFEGLESTVGVLVSEVSDGPKRAVSGVLGGVAEDEIRCAELSHVSGLSSLLSDVWDKTRSARLAAWDAFKSACGGYVELLNSLTGAGESLKGLFASITTMSAVPAGPTSTFAPAGIPMVIQLKGSVSSLKSLVGSLESSLGSIIMLARQYGFIDLEGVGQWLGLARDALATVGGLVGSIPVG